MTRGWLPIALALALGLGLGLGGLPAAAADRLEGVAAVVDDDVILISEVDAKAQPLIQQLTVKNAGPLPPEVKHEIRSQAMESLIASRLILNMAERMGLEASPEEIDEAVEGIARQEGLQVEEIYAAAGQQGLDRSQYREQLAEQITRMKVIGSAVRSRITIKDEEIRELYEERYGQQRPGMHAIVRHILIPWPDPESGEPREMSLKIVQEILHALEEGRSFASLAQQFSAAPSAMDGGRTTLRQGEAHGEIEKWAFELEPGEVSPPIETAHGVNLIQLIERFDAGAVSYESVEDNLRYELTERKVNPEIDDWVKELRSQVYVEVVAPDLK
jgi:peptidyl-prolyl cis-trans isomerase SurA